MKTKVTATPSKAAKKALAAGKSPAKKTAATKKAAPAKKAPAKKAATKAAKPAPAPKEEPPHKLPRLTKEQKAQLEAQKEAALEAGDLNGASHTGGLVNDNLVPIVRKSVVTNPVLAAWDLFDNLLAESKANKTPLRRKDAIAKAVDRGIAFYTARTQYQSWKVANKI